jgi:hypothetical protein
MGSVKIARCQFFDRCQNREGYLRQNCWNFCFISRNAQKIRTSVAWVGWHVVRTVEVHSSPAENTRMADTHRTENRKEPIMKSNHKPRTQGAVAEVIEQAKIAPRTPSMMPRAMETVTVKLSTVDATPDRLLQFLRALSQLRPMRSSLEKLGFGNEEYLLGWRLLHRASGYHPPEEHSVDAETVHSQQDLDTEMDFWLQVVDLSLRHRHPDQHAVVFAIPVPVKEDGSLITMPRLLDRVDVLENGKDRVEFRAADHAALATLSKRGLTKEKRIELRKMQNAAEGHSANQSDPMQSNDARNLQYLYEARAWYEEWSGLARKVVTRRDYLIRAGLAQRRSASGVADEGDDGEDTTGDEGEINTPAPSAAKPADASPASP